MISREIFGKHNGKNVYLFTITNPSGNTVKLTNFGARLVWIEVPDRNGIRDNITFGYGTFEETLEGDMSFGSTIGQYANRIGGGKFEIDGTEYRLPLNDGTNTLHGGPLGWHSAVWDAEILNRQVKFSYLCADMEQGFPGNVTAEVTYTLTENNEIIIDFKWKTDRKTVVNLTNHAYFNLHGAGRNDILDHVLTLKASAFTPVDTYMIPAGEIRPVAGTPFDFTSPHTIGERIENDDEQLHIGKGYDHNFVLDNNDDVDAILYDPASGRMLEVITDQPGMQLYTGNFLDGSQKGHGGKAFNYRSGVCLESGRFPDSPNKPHFPSTLAEPGVVYTSTTIYRLTIK
jgi:aldose 1-epimerase